jgi:Tfp pilus assembly protein PilV
MGGHTYNPTAASNTSIDGVGSQGSNRANLVDDNLRALAAGIANLVRDLGGANTSVGGTADAVTVALADPSVPSAYFDGMIFSFRVASDNTLTTTTLNVDSLGAKTIKKAVAGVETAIVAGDLQAGMTAMVVYRSAWASAAGAFELLNPYNVNTGTINATTGNIPTLAGVTSMNSGPLAGFRNHIINGAMMVAQRGTSFTSTSSLNNDDTYNLDRWILLADGADTVDVTQATDAPTNGLNSIGLDVETVNRKFGILQVIEQKNCIGLIGNTVTLSFKARVSSTTKLDNLKAAIISWSGTADAVTSDIISAWGAENTNPTLVANWTYENTPADLNPTTSWASYSVSAAVDTASTKNIGVFIWSDVTDTTLGDFLYITDVQLEIGSVATPFERRPYGLEFWLCQRYYETGKIFVDGYSSGGNAISVQGTFKATKFVSPTMSNTFSYSLNTSGGVSDAITTTEFRSYAIVTGTAAAAFSNTWVASAEL